MTKPENTSNNPEHALAEALTNLFKGQAPERAIYDQEARGAAEIADNDCEVIPTELVGCSEDDLRELGFDLGDASPADPLFRTAVLPEGWSRRRTEHDMWTELVDQSGEPRARIFYKAAFYDRRAHLHLISTEKEN